MPFMSMARLPNIEGSLPGLSVDEIFEMVDKSRNSTDALSDYGSSAGSTISSVWESSEPDISDSEAEDEATDFSGSCSPSELHVQVDPVDEGKDLTESKDLTEKTNSHEQREPSPAPASHYNLRSGSKRKSSTTDGPPAKKPCPPKVFCNDGRQNHGGHSHGDPGHGGYDGSGSSGGKGRSKQGGTVQGSIQNGGSIQHESSVSKQKGKKTKTNPLNALPLSAISIQIKEKADIAHDDFCPLREPGVYLPNNMDISALSLFELFFDETVLKRLLDSTLDYAELKQAEKCKRYRLFMKQKLTVTELKAYLGALLLLGIHSVRNHRKAWSTAKAQVLIRLRDLLTCQRFELIGTFLHVVTKQEEEEVKQNRLRKLLPLINYIKSKCFEFYQPVKELSVDERMVKSKARSHLIQYMRNKPVKWGFKVWVIADPSGYTLDFDIYTGKGSNGKSDHGVAYGVVMKLMAPFFFQGYHLYIDNFYTSRRLLDDLYHYGVYTTGTFRIDRRGVPSDVKTLKEILNGRNITRGTGYYYRPAIQDSETQDQSTQSVASADQDQDPPSESCATVEPPSYYLRLAKDEEVIVEVSDDHNPSPVVYTVWRDTRAVCVMSSAFPGHSENTVSKKKTNPKTGAMDICDIAIPIVVQKYNKYMGGVDKSDQYLSYHNVLRKTVRYWKTLFYHMVDIAAVNAFIIYNYTASLRGIKTITENDFRDQLVLQMINVYGKNCREKVPLGRHPQSEERIKHGSFVFPIEQRARCQYCYLRGEVNWTQRKCKDCNFQPALCQVQGRDCHLNWHKPSFDEKRNKWFQNHQKSDLPQQPVPTYFTRSQATEQNLVREQGETHVEQSETCREQDETCGEQDETPGKQDETPGEQDKTTGEQDETSGEQGEAHGEYNVSCGEQTESESHELYQKESFQGSPQELQNVPTPTSLQPQEILILRPRNPATRHSAR